MSLDQLKASLRQMQDAPAPQWLFASDTQHGAMF
jgi:hypothetical protein